MKNNPSSGTDITVGISSPSEVVGHITSLPDKLVQVLRDNSALSEILANWQALALPDCWLVAGAVVQSYWNKVHGFPPLHGVSDIDIIYFDPGNLDEQDESRHAARVAGLFNNLPLKFDVKNEAAVHLWYEQAFGYSITPYTSSAHAIDTFPTTAGAIGIRPSGASIEAYTTFGFDDLLGLVVRPNKRQITRTIYEQKVSRWRATWPKLTFIAWDAEQA